ncbi:hypothetical protein [Salipaludibacillus daqingensis]|uniref:hypothetical protein n=1 Tax=Salipaludibacillus daqingensis TaxID=3041001 RepID=UPI0024762AE6|nr:hypothetical protein [Salipaludibacillus daqingensis]
MKVLTITAWAALLVIIPEYVLGMERNIYFYLLVILSFFIGAFAINYLFDKKESIK